VNVASDVAEIMSRIVRYLSGANYILQLPLAEVILTNKDRGYKATTSRVLCQLIIMSAWNDATIFL